MQTFVYVDTLDNAPFGNGSPLEPIVACTVEAMVDQIDTIAGILTTVINQALVDV